MSAAQQIIRGMIEGNLQQGWALLDNEQWDMAKHHFSEAIKQVDELANVAKEDAETRKKHQLKQPTLDV
jgi:hypothetical protein